MNKRGLVEIILLIVLVILVIGGGYLVLTKESSLQQPEQEQIQCNIGNFITLPTPFGVAGGPITGVETHELANEETKSPPTGSIHLRNHVSLGFQDSA